MALFIVALMADTDVPAIFPACPPVQRLQALPGYGWDNLQNKAMRPILLQTYDHCRQTLDGKYSLPDGAFDQPVRSSNVEIVSELIEHWSNYTDVTARSMTASASLYIDTVLFGAGGISGSFTQDYRSTKRQQYDDKAITTRTTARYVQYSIGMESNYRLDPELETRLRVILQHIEAGGRNDTIRLLSQLLVRDYGTHVILRVDVGGVIVKEDMISSEFLNTMEKTERSKVIRGAASYSFFDFFKADASYKQTSQDVTANYAGYIDSRSSSVVRSYGGVFYKPEQCSNTSNCLTRWVESVPDNLVTVDRDGDPLHFIVQPGTLRNVSAPLLKRLSQEIAAALRDYYNQNTHRGCLDIKSTNFEYYANMDDNTCQNATYNYTFGGLYQTCTTPAVWSDIGDLCNKMNLQLINPVTGGLSCPNKYMAVVLRRNEARQDGCHQECHGWWIFERCSDSCGTSVAEYVTYWCAAIEGMATENGVFFGGLYTSTTDNLLTGSKSCPPMFQPFGLLTDLKICLGVDVEFSVPFAVTFGGFFSCDHGNPLYSKMLTVGSKLLRASAASDPVYAQACPIGFSQHMAVIDQNCYVYYCVKANSFGIHGDIQLQLPPYIPYDAIFGETALQQLQEKEVPGSNAPLSAGPVVGFVIAGITISVLVAILTVIGVRKWRARRNAGRGDGGMERGLLEDQEEGGAGGVQ